MRELNRRLSALEAKVNDNGETTKKIFAAIYGNGKNGLITDLALLQQSVEMYHHSLEKFKSRRAGFWQWVISTAVAIAAVVAVLIK